MSFRDNLLYLRDARNMTQEQLAMLLGVTRQAVSKWESGASTPDMDRLVRLCEIFEVDLDDLIRGDVTAQPVDQALAIPPDTPVTDVTGYDPHMRGRALFIAGGAAFAIFGIAGVACLCVGIVYAGAVCVGAACIYAVHTGSVCVEAVCATLPGTC